MNTKTLKIIVLALISFFIIAALSSCGSVSPAARYAKEHEDKNFETALKNNEQFTLRSYEDDLKTLKARVKALDKKNVTEAKKAQLLAEIEALKASIK